MRFSTCMHEGKTVNLKVVHTRLNSHFIYELKDILYSGPPSTKEERNGDYVKSTSESAPKTELESELSNPDENLESTSDSILKSEASHNIDHSLSVDNNNDSENCGVVSVKEESPELDCSSLSLPDISKPCADNVNSIAKDASLSDSALLNGEREIDKDTELKSDEEMVRLIQEPKPAKAESHSLRKGNRNSVKSGSLNAHGSKSNKANPKDLRRRRISHSDLSDSELSDHCRNNRNCVSLDNSRTFHKNGDTLNVDNSMGLASSNCKLNGDSVSVNGVNKLKLLRSHSVSEDSDSSDCLKSTENGVDHDNDKVDINLLLEISPKDRKIFENKKAKVKRKCSDWMLISETEQYYNEKEAILRNKNRVDPESDSDSSEMCEKELPKSYSLKKSDKRQSKERRSGAALEDSLESNMERRSCRSNKAKVSSDSGSKLTGKGLCHRGKGKVSKHDDSKPKKRLSDAERFLKDNREYYMFTETRDRLRSNTMFKNSKSERKDSESDDYIEVVDILPDNEKSPHSHESSHCPASENLNKKVRGRRVSRRHSTEQEDPVEQHYPGLSHTTPKLEINDTIDDLYFSFEGSPVQEPYYKTYQRFIDGVKPIDFRYDSGPLKFVLPYEMPKEYFRELHLRKYLLCRKKSDPFDLTRKSPRCHASTLALFSDIITNKKDKKKTSQKGATKPETTKEVPEEANSSTVDIPKFIGPYSFESAEELLFIGQCIDHVMNTTIEDPLIPTEPPKESKVTKGSKKKKRMKRKSSTTKREKLEIPVESKAFDNVLSAEVDANFLLQLPKYLDEIAIAPEDTLSKDSAQLCKESTDCSCTERLTGDLTEDGSENVSVCDSETVDSLSSSQSATVRRKFGSGKKRRLNLTGWPNRKKKKPIPNVQSQEDNDSVSSYSQPRKSSSPKKRKIKKLHCQLLEPGNVSLHSSPGLDRRISMRKRSSILYADSWPLRLSEKN